MGKIVTIVLDDAAAAHWERLARDHGRSIEAELAALAEREIPLATKDSALLLRLSDEALAMTPPDRPTDISDSTLLIRWDRDTSGGRWVDDGWDDAGR